MVKIVAYTPAALPRKGWTSCGHLAAKDRARLGSYQERVRFDQAVKPGEDTEMALVMKAGTVKMPPDALSRLQALSEKAIAIGALMDKTGA